MNPDDTKPKNEIVRGLNEALAGRSSSLVARGLRDLATKAPVRRTHPLRIVMAWREREPGDPMFQLVQAFLHKKGATVLTFQEGENVWDELVKTDPDVLVMYLYTTFLKSDPERRVFWELLARLAERNVRYPIAAIMAFPSELQSPICLDPASPLFLPVEAKFLQPGNHDLNLTLISLSENFLIVLEEFLEDVLNGRTGPTLGVSPSK